MNPRLEEFITSAGTIKVLKSIFKGLKEWNAVGARDLPEREIGGGVAADGGSYIGGGGRKRWNWNRVFDGGSDQSDGGGASTWVCLGYIKIQVVE